jgi:hypothetical protein
MIFKSGFYTLIKGLKATFALESEPKIYASRKAAKSPRVFFILTLCGLAALREHQYRKDRIP